MVDEREAICAYLAARRVDEHQDLGFDGVESARRRGGARDLLGRVHLEERQGGGVPTTTRDSLVEMDRDDGGGRIVPIHRRVKSIGGGSGRHGVLKRTARSRSIGIDISPQRLASHARDCRTRALQGLLAHRRVLRAGVRDRGGLQLGLLL